MMCHSVTTLSPGMCLVITFPENLCWLLSLSMCLKFLYVPMWLFLLVLPPPEVWHTLDEHNSRREHFSDIIMFPAMHGILRMMGRVLHLDPPSILFYHTTSRTLEDAERGPPPGVGGRGSRIHERKGEFYSMVPKFFESFFTDTCCLCFHSLNQGGFEIYPK